MKIKTNKTVTLLELVELVRKGNMLIGYYESNQYSGEREYFIGTNLIERVLDSDSDSRVYYSDRFDIEIEKEMTEETPMLTMLFGVYVENDTVDSDSWVIAGAKIKNIKKKYPERDFMSFYDLKTGKRIWTKENGFEDGVLEVFE